MRKLKRFGEQLERELAQTTAETFRDEWSRRRDAARDELVPAEAELAENESELAALREQSFEMLLLKKRSNWSLRCK